MTTTWNDTGVTHEVRGWSGPGIPDFDPRGGDHYWIVCPTYQVQPANWTKETLPVLDLHNLRMIAGPLCFYCEQPYTPRLGKRRCPGESR